MTNLEFENLLQMKKVFVKDNVSLPSRGEAGIFDLKSKTTNDKFYLDVDRRGRIEFSKFKIQNRFAGNKLPLVRIDIDREIIYIFLKKWRMIQEIFHGHIV